MQRWLDSSSTLKVLTCWLALIVAWEAAYRVIAWKPVVFPAPSHVLDSTVEMLGMESHFGDALHRGWPMTAMPWGAATADAPLIRDAGKASLLTRILASPLVAALLVSGMRLLVGFTLSVMLGLVLGLLMWRYRFLDAMLGPVFLGLQTLPSVCWVPLAILTLGFTEWGILLVLVLGSFFAIAISLRDGLRATPPIYRAAGLVFGARRFSLYRYVMLPSGLPAMASSLRSGFSFAWRSLMGGELIFTMVRWRGVGFQLYAGREAGEIAQVVAVMLFMVVIGMSADRLAFARIEHRIRLRFGLTQ